LNIGGVFPSFPARTHPRSDSCLADASNVHASKAPKVLGCSDAWAPQEDHKKTSEKSKRNISIATIDEDPAMATG